MYSKKPCFGVLCQGQNKNTTHKTLYGFDNEQELYDFFVWTRHDTS